MFEKFNIEKKDIITITGAGGKTTLMFLLSSELSKFGKVMATTTTKIYTPDFIIKIEVPNKKNRYLVLDSKWQKNKTLKNYTLKEIIYKYCYSIEGTEEVDYLNTIILQGKEDISTNYSFQNSMLSLKAKNIKKPKLEIVPLNPKINKLNYVLKIIEELF